MLNPTNSHMKKITLTNINKLKYSILVKVNPIESKYHLSQLRNDNNTTNNTNINYTTTNYNKIDKPCVNSQAPLQQGSNNILSKCR